ncbi:mast cell protease 1A-like isoform X3 [Lepisosteus oculatus]|uniref:mast cell protease 1A-like isoform X3 n=1 Tax=Lepisosteus oculatus TaxID=7918 RepID=UPI0007403B58|nr:PREDICTED: mast cell protease 1A-like isoform X1 [Lepisosteus oculatus]
MLSDLHRARRDLRGETGFRTDLKQTLWQRAQGSFDADIIDGEEVKGKSQLYMASIQVNGTHRCGGFLISKNFVMTAAHCSKGSERMSVVLGAHNIASADARRYGVKREYRHPDFKNVTLGSDIMLLQLSKPVKRGKGINVIKYPRKDRDIKPKTSCTVAGWGATKTQGRAVASLRVVNVSVMDTEVCRNMWQRKLPADIICAGGYKTKKGACQGDSGGPLVCGGEALGIVSFNSGNCDYPNWPNIYTRVSKYLPWIQKIVRQSS